jgi:hypothetical protein
MNKELFQAQTPGETTDLRFLDPNTLRFRRQGARLRLARAGEVGEIDVTVVRVFPLSNPRRYLSVRDMDENEIGLLVDLEQLDETSRRLVREELDRRYIIPVIQRIVSVRERFGTIDWTVATNYGRRLFTTRNLRENVVQPAPNRYILTDVDGNRYDLRDVESLDKVSQAWVLRYL